MWFARAGGRRVGGRAAMAEIDARHSARTLREGLVIAIPTLGVFAFFRNRIEELVAEASTVANHVFAPLRRKATGKPVRPIQVAPVTPGGGQR